MLTIKDKKNKTKAIIYADNIDLETENQIKQLLKSPISVGSKIRIMPDTHAGAGGVIGLTMTIKDKVSPMLVGSDIGCGVSLFPFYVSRKLNLELIDKIIREKVPYGYRNQELDLSDVNKKFSMLTTNRLNEWVKELSFVKNKNDFSMYYHTALFGLGTLGGGNHFIEIYEGQYVDGVYGYYMAIHTGSRRLGGETYKIHNKLSSNEVVDEANKKYKNGLSKLIKELKSSGREKEIESSIVKYKQENEHLLTLGKNDGELITYLKGKQKDNYIKDVGIVTKYASLNRQITFEEIINNYNVITNELVFPMNSNYRYIDKPHNYIDVERNILRKGSQSSEDVCLIPINMRDGLMMATAKSYKKSKKWNYSAPHGAGRLLSRTKAKNQLSVDDFKEQMKNIYSSTVGEETLDEAPNAYKSMEYIKNNLIDDFNIIKILKPIYNFKGSKEFEKQKKEKVK